MENAILYAEVNAVCSLFLLLLCVKVKDSMFLQEQRRLFFNEAFANVLFLMLDFLWIFVDRSVVELSVTLNWALNAAYYILSGILGYCWFAFSESIQDSNLIRERRFRVLCFAPMALLAVLTLCSLRTGWLFYIDAENHYHRGPAYVLQLLTAYGYIVFTALKAFYASLHTLDYRKKYELRTLGSFVLPTLVAGGLQVAFPGYPILCVGNTFGILYVYITLQEQLISKDALTKLNNRHQLMQVLSTKLAHPREDKILYLLIMDVDYFKSINDKYGHVEGDRALKTVAACLMSVCARRNYFVSRFGGDEFVALCELAPEENIQSVCDAIHASLAQVNAPYALVLSIGCARYTPDIRTQQEFIDRADRELYKIKMNRPRK